MNIRNNKLSATAAAFLFPAIAFVLFASVIPFFWNLILSFEKWDGFSTPQAVGFANFIACFKDKTYVLSLKNSILYAFGSTLGAVVIGLMLATLIYHLQTKATGFFRLTLYIPTMLPTAVVGMMFIFFFNPTMGLLNSFLRVLHLDDLTHVWLQDKATAMVCIAIVGIWKNAGQVMLLCFAAMQTVPSSLYEASELDGAGFYKQTFFVTYPLIKSSILLATVNTLGSQFKSYDLIFTMTQGGPGTLTTTVPIYMTKVAFNYGKFGNASSQGVIFTLVVAASIILVRLLLRGDSYEY